MKRRPPVGVGARGGDEVGSLSDMPLESLLSAALDERRRDAGDAPRPVLVELHRRATDDVLARALGWSTSDDADERGLAVEVLRELGPADRTGRRPFSDRTIPRLLVMLRAAGDAGAERSILQALAFNGATEALDEFIVRVDHSDVGVRTTIAFQLPSVLVPDAPEPRAVDALLRLTSDVDADVRFYALHALLVEGIAVDPALALDAARRRVDDPDSQVRALAGAHSAERVLTPVGPLAISLAAGASSLGVPDSVSVLRSGGRTARWDDVDGLTVEALVVPYTHEDAVLGHPRCSCWAVVWRLHAQADTAAITVSAHLPDLTVCSPGGGQHLVTAEFEDEAHHLAIGGPHQDAFDDEVRDGLHAPSWRYLFAHDGPYADVARSTPQGLSWRLPPLLAGESASTHVAIAWTGAGHAGADEAVVWAVDVSRQQLRDHAGLPRDSLRHPAQRTGRSTSARSRACD